MIGVHSAKFPSEKLTQNIRDAVLRYGIEHPVVNDAGFKIWNAYNVHAWPTIAVIDPKGEIVGMQPGEIDAEDFIPVIEGMIEEYESQGILNHQPLDMQPEAWSEPGRPLSFPSKVLAAPHGRRLYVADTGDHRIVELSFDTAAISARVERVFGSGRPALQDGQAAEAAFHSPRGMALVGDTLYVADTNNHAIRAIELTSGTVRTLAGTGEKGAGRLVQGTPTEIPLRSPWALLALENATEDGKHVLFIAMAGSHQIWLMLGEERLGVFAGNGREALVDGPLAEASFNQPSDLALGLGHLLVADAEASAIRAISLGENPRAITLVGQGLFEFGDVDGAGPEVRLQHPAGIAFSEASNYVYVADTYNNKIKRLDPTEGRVETLVGTGRPGIADGPFASAELSEPEGLAVLDGRLVIVDTNNHLLRVADLTTGMLSTVTLHGLENLPRSAGAGEQKPGAADGRLQPVTVSPGLVTFTFDLQLPPGYKLNPDAPSELTAVDECQAASTNGDAFPIPEDRIVTLSKEVGQDCELTLDMTLYYCQEGDERLCLIHDRRLVLPVMMSAGAPDAVQVTYSVA